MIEEATAFVVGKEKDRALPEFRGDESVDDIGHFAHLGGALVAFLLVLYWNKSNKETFY